MPFKMDPIERESPLARQWRVHVSRRIEKYGLVASLRKANENGWINPKPERLTEVYSIRMPWKYQTLFLASGAYVVVGGTLKGSTATRTGIQTFRKKDGPE